MTLLIGLDLGQAQDYTALAIAEQLQLDGQRHYHFRHLERFPLATPYPVVVSKVCGIYRQLRPSYLIVDNTGVGRAVDDMFRKAGVSPIAVTITGGDSVTREPGGYHVPKRELVGRMQVLLQSKRVKFAETLPEVATLVRELLSFQVKINAKTAHDSYGAWREGTHDDLVLAVALAVWYGESVAGWARGPSKGTWG